MNTTDTTDSTDSTDHDPDSFTAVMTSSGWAVDDSRGGRWYPDAEAQSVLLAAGDLAGDVIVPLCVAAPSLGRWVQ